MQEASRSLRGSCWVLAPPHPGTKQPLAIHQRPKEDDPRAQATCKGREEPETAGLSVGLRVQQARRTPCAPHCQGPGVRKTRQFLPSLSGPGLSSPVLAAVERPHGPSSVTDLTGFPSTPEPSP